MNSVQPDYLATVAFLRVVHPDRLWTLTGILPDTMPRVPTTVTATFDASREDECLAWLRKFGEKRNLYWSVAEPLTSVTKKLDRSDVKAVHWLHCDIDPNTGEPLDTEQARILATLAGDTLPGNRPAPTIIVNSGGGFQALWKLAEPIVINGDVEKAESAKLHNLTIELALAADSCHDVTRLLRLPGTVNRPSEKKRKRGRVDALARVVACEVDRVYSIDRFPPTQLDNRVDASKPATSAAAPAVDTSNIVRLGSLDDLPPSVLIKTKVIINQGVDPDEPNRHGASRSEWVMRVACDLIRAKVPDDVIYSVLTDSRFGIAASVIDKGREMKRYALRQIKRARDTTAVAAAQSASGDGGWITDKNGVIVSNNPDNVRLALTRLGITLRYDKFADKKLATIGETTMRLEDKHFVTWRLDVYDRFRFLPSAEVFDTILNDTCYRNEFHPVLDYFDGLTWDGVKRIDRLLTTYMGADDTRLNAAIGRIFVVAAVRRVREPGVKYDEMMTLEGGQGTGKSTFFRILAVKPEWHSDNLPINARASERIEAMKGKWIIEAAEIAGLSRAELENVKAFLSRSTDAGTRLAYGKTERDYPRTCVFGGSTNDTSYLRDTTGNRRFWPVSVDRCRIDELTRDVDQIWAEAATAEATGESIRLDPSLYPHAAEQQEERRTVSAIEEKLSPIFGPGGANGRVDTAEVWNVLEISDLEKKQRMGSEVGKIMQSFGFKRMKLRKDGKPDWFYVRGDRQMKIFPT